MCNINNFSLEDIEINRYENCNSELWQAEIYARLNVGEESIPLGKILYTLENGKMNLDIIKIVDKYQRLGIGSKLLSIMFDDCKKFGISNIEGEFAPLDYAQGYAFYTKHGFEIREEVLVDKIYKTIEIEAEGEQ